MGDAEIEGAMEIEGVLEGVAEGVLEAEFDGEAPLVSEEVGDGVGVREAEAVGDGDGVGAMMQEPLMNETRSGPPPLKSGVVTFLQPSCIAAPTVASSMVLRAGPVQSLELKTVAMAEELDVQFMIPERPSSVMSTRLPRVKASRHPEGML